MALQEKYNPHSPVNGQQKSPVSAKRRKSFKDRDMQVIIGWILRVGVVTSMIIVFIGGALFIFRHGHSIPDYHHFNGVPDFIRTPGGIINGILSFRGQAIIQAGIILLIATPIIRVAFSAIGFLIEKDYLYTAITLVVLLIIVASMLGGHMG
jgi:uncharacterized membrane protein